LAVPATVVTANLTKDTLVSITANNTVDKAALNATPMGRLVVPSKTANGLGTVETRFKELIEIKTTAIVAAGDKLKLTAPDGTTGENTVGVWVSGTDGAERLFGVAWKGAASGGVAEVLTY
jgi:hypothetical protein